MSDNLLQQLKDWRRIAAQNEGAPAFRVFTNKVLENIAELKPANKEELMAIKGIRDRKFAKYGEEILAMTNADKENFDVPGITIGIQPEKPFSVSAYLDFLNQQLSQRRARIQGEISSVNIRERVIYFSLKDAKDESVISCLIWKNDYELSGIDFEIGMEVILGGTPDVYKPTGRLAFKASSAELVGEGALKKAYDQLKKKLDKEGLFAAERKKSLPDWPRRIGLITSKEGAVIHDFLTNLGQYGYQIKFVDSRVEGQTAVHDLIAAIDYFDCKDIDVLVIIRGGGSLESLQAFNNETLARQIAYFKIPVICGIGHEKDVPLASLAADLRVSTPTAATIALNKSWEKARKDIQIMERDIFYKYQQILDTGKRRLEIMSGNLKDNLENILKKFNIIERQLFDKINNLGYALKNIQTLLRHYSNNLAAIFDKNLSKINDRLDNAENRLIIANPLRQLKLGYSIAKINGAVIKSVGQAKQGERIDIQISDGTIESRINNIINN